MLVGCKNCGGLFNGRELAQMKPPMHAWKLTEAGERTQNENIATGANPWPCPSCGHRSLRAAVVGAV
jgi:rubrerythrin